MSAEIIPGHPAEPVQTTPELRLVATQEDSLLLMHVLLQDAAKHVLSYADKDRHHDGRPRLIIKNDVI